MQETVTGSGGGHLAGSAWLEPTDGVALLHPEDAVMNAMLDGWTKQQRARRLIADTAEDRCQIVRRFTEFAGVCRRAAAGVRHQPHPEGQHHVGLGLACANTLHRVRSYGVPPGLTRDPVAEIPRTLPPLAEPPIPGGPRP